MVDDDASVRRSLERLIRSVGLQVETFESAQKFLTRERVEAHSCLVLDIRMPGLSGLELQDELIARNWKVPIIFLTGYGSIQMCVRAMKAGAVDFIEKPFDEQILLDAVQRALEQNRQYLQTENEIKEIRRRIESLTAREHQVFMHVLQGKLNKQIAYELGTGEKNIKVHRARVLRKMQAASVAGLAQMAGKAHIAVPKDSPAAGDSSNSITGASRPGKSLPLSGPS